MKKILLTGASGRFGPVVHKLLSEHGFDVRAVDRMRNPESPMPVTVTNILSRTKCYELVDGIDAIVHLANYSRDELRDPQTLYTENITMNINIVHAAMESGIKHLIFSSSIQTIVGDYPSPYNPHDVHASCTLPYIPADSDTPANPTNYYALSKVTSEKLLRFYANTYGMHCTVVRFPAIHRPEWLERKRSWKKEVYRACPDECFSYLSATDAARFIEVILQKKPSGFRIYFPAARTPIVNVSVPELIYRFYRKTPLRKPFESLTSLVDISRVTEETGWEPLDNYDIFSPQEQLAEVEKWAKMMV